MTTTSATGSIASTLGIGSGIDTASLIDKLAAASLTPKDTALKARETANTAKVSALATVSSGITNFSTALNTLIAGGTLRTQPSVSDTSILTATTQSGARIADLSAQIEVTQLATAQSLASGHVATAETTAIGQGTMTLTTAAGSFTIAIGSTNDSLSGLAAAINAAGAGVTAGIVSDAQGARLTLKGATGAANAFTLAADSGAAAGLSAFTYDGTSTNTANGMSQAQAAQDAILKLDGVQVTRAGNSIDDLVAGITLDLKTAKAGTTVSLGVTRPTSAITQAVTDFVSAYNELQTMLTTQTAAKTSTADAGALRGESAIREMQRQLARLTATAVNTGGGPQTLAEIGVATNRDGTLTLNTTRLASVIASDPTGVEAMFNPGQHSDSALLQITSPMGRAKAGTYAVTGVTAQTSTASAAGSIAGIAAVTTGKALVASFSSKASGLTIKVLGDVASAKLIVDQGIAGALQAISDTLLGASGPLASTKSRLATEATRLATDRTKLGSDDTSYRARLNTQFTAMDSRVAAYKSTQSFIEEQVKVWTNSNN